MLKNLAVLITGAAGTLGSATARKLISEGCKVTLLDLPKSKGKDLENELGKDAIFIPGDVTSCEEVNKALEQTVERFGNLRGVVNCAGVYRSFNILNSKGETEFSNLKEVLDVSILGTMNVISYAVRFMAKNHVDRNDLRGVIINTSGFGAFDGKTGQLALSASWGAISSMTLPLCRELGDKGIRVMAIAPGLIDSPLIDLMSNKVIESYVTHTPFPKRLGQKEEFAELVVTIMKNNFLNGEVIRLDGGLRLNM